MPAPEQHDSDSEQQSRIRFPSLAERIAAINSQAGVGKYNTTANSCQCPDHKYRNRACKHIEAYWVLFGKEYQGGMDANVTGRDHKCNLEGG